MCHNVESSVIDHLSDLVRNQERSRQACFISLGTMNFQFQDPQSCTEWCYQNDLLHHAALNLDKQSQKWVDRQALQSVALENNHLPADPQLTPLTYFTRRPSPDMNLMNKLTSGISTQITLLPVGNKIEEVYFEIIFYRNANSFTCYNFFKASLFSKITLRGKKCFKDRIC